MAVGGYTATYLTVYLRPADRGAAPAYARRSRSARSIVLIVEPARRRARCRASPGCVVGIPSLRLRGDYLAIVTLGFGEIIRVVILNIDAVGGARGFTDAIPHHELLLGLLLSRC